MKRVSKILILLLVMFIPFTVKADMGAPEIKSYEATVIKSDGIDYYDEKYNESKDKWEYIKKGHLNNADKFTVEYEFTSDSYHFSQANVYFLIRLNGDNNSYYVLNDDTKYIKPVNKEYNPTNEDLNYEGRSANVRINKDVPILKGPASAYELVGTIPKGTKLSYRYAIGDQTTYIYVEYNGLKGWINVENSKVLFERDEPYIFYPFEDIDTPCGKVKAMDSFKSVYRTDDWTRDFTIDTDTCSEILNDNTYGVLGEKVDDADLTLTVEKTVYSKAYGKGEKVTTIPKGKTMKVLYAATDSKNMDGEYLVEYNGKQGYISALESEVDWGDDEPTTTTAPTTTEQVPEETTVIATTEPINPKSSANKTRNVIIVSVIVGVALAITAIVIIVLVNKKKKVEPTEEVKPVEPETVMTENDLNLVKEKEESKEETPEPDNKENNGEE